MSTGIFDGTKPYTVALAPNRSYQSAAILAGTVAGLVTLFDAASPRPGGLSGVLFAGPLLLLGQAIAGRSWLGMLLIPLGAILPIAWVSLNPFTINGREDLPVTVLITPCVVRATPWYDDIPLGWQARAIITFVVYWFLIDALLFGSRYYSEARERRVRFPKDHMFLAVVASTALALIAYRLSWWSMLSGTFMRPLDDQPDWRFWISLALFTVIFPFKGWSLNYFYEVVASPGERKNACATN